MRGIRKREKKGWSEERARKGGSEGVRGERMGVSDGERKKEIK